MTDFHAMYERYADQVWRFAFFLSGDRALADDVTSETFVRAWTTAGPLREETVKAYLLTIARHLVIDAARRARRQTELDAATPDAHSSPHQQAESREALGFVLHAMHDLSPVDRAALLMRAQENMSYEEIAHALGLSLTSAKVKIHRARARLMKARNASEEHR